MVLTEMNDEDPAAEHSRPTVRQCRVEKDESGSCGFHLTRTKWDPYPWIAGVDEGSLAESAGLKIGDCVLEINGEDVLGLKIGDIADKAHLEQEYIIMLLWNSGSDTNCDKESLCCTPMPTSLSRLSSCLSSILGFIECPVCFDIIPPPAHQCPLGHLICFKCRVCTDKCPICRTAFNRERCLLADQIYNSLVEAFHLKSQSIEERTKKLWERLFGKRRCRTSPPKTELKNKFLSKLIGKSSSVDNIPNMERAPAEFRNSLRKKSISHCDLPRSVKRYNNIKNSCQSTESLGSSASCGNLHHVTYFHKPKFQAQSEHLFNFTSPAGFRCPISSECDQSTDLLEHVQEHEGPVIQFRRPEFTIDFPFSFRAEAIITSHSYDKLFFIRVVEDDSSLKIYVWIMDTVEVAETYRVKARTYGSPDETELTFSTFVGSLMADKSENVFRNQIIITSGTRDAYFSNQFSLDIQIISKN